MPAWWKKKTSLAGSVPFRGSMQPSAADFEPLRKHGIEVTPQARREGAEWHLALKHPRWGAADLVCFKSPPLPPPEIIRYSVLSAEEAEQALQGKSMVSLMMEAQQENVLRDRKNLLYYLGAALGRDGLAAIDHTAGRLWSRESLDDELCHDADLDIESIYTIHVVTHDEEPIWLHTHGLAEIGNFDFDILEPSKDIARAGGGDLLRSIALAIVEGSVSMSTPRYPVASPGGDVRFVSAEEFTSGADAALAARLRPNAHDGHNSQRAVLCEPGGGFLSRWFGSGLKPSRFLSGEIPDTVIMQFSTEASRLMAARARSTFNLFRTFAAEFREFECPAIVKLGYRVDGGDEDDKEHLWFEVHETFDDAIDATLSNQPYNIARMKMGERGRHPLELLSDWMVLTPAGPISPRFTTPARVLRSRKDEIRGLIKKAKAGG